MEEEQRNKQHKSRATGNKAARKDETRKKKAGIELEPNRGHNPRAFQGPSTASHKSQQKVRSVEKKEATLHMPSEDKTLSHLVGDPPLLVAVVGPPGVGKTTLIRSMVKFYSGRNLTNLAGPVTVVAGHSRRVTFMECPNTLAAMCDMAKVADLVLLMVDGSYGFEMETFEFLSIAQVHGFPKIFGVVSHLDQMKTSKALKKQKKFLRHRFWHEVAAGAKLLCLSPMHHGTYRPNDVLKLHRLLICVQTKVQQWRNTHSCVFIDRHEDLTNPDDIAQNENVSRTVAFFGYVRGKPMKSSDQMIHIPGFGDFSVAHVSRQEDPCSFVKKSDSTSQGHRMRHLNEKHKRLYAPYCSVGGVTYDEDAIYIQEDAERQTIERTGEGVTLLRDLQRVQPVDERVTKLDIVRRPVNFKDEDTLDIDMEEPEMPEDSSSDESDDSDDADAKATSGRGGKLSDTLKDFGLVDSENESGVPALKGAEEDDEWSSMAPRLPDEKDAIRVHKLRFDWTTQALLSRVKELFVTGSWKGSNPTHQRGEGEESMFKDLDDKGYDSDDEEFEQEIRGDVNPSSKAHDSAEDDDDEDHGVDADSENEDGNAFGAAASRPLNALACISSSLHGTKAVKSAKMGKLTRVGVDSKFAAGGGDNEEDGEDNFNILDEPEEKFRDIQDEELRGLLDHFSKPTTSLQEAEGVEIVDPSSRFQRRFVDKAELEDENALSSTIQSGQALSEEQEDLLRKRMAKKKAFDENYDVDGGKNNTMGYYYQLQRDVEEKREALDEAMRSAGEDLDTKIRLVGFFSGLYVRLVLENVPVEFLRNFDPKTPLIAGGLNAGEDQLQVVHAKIKRHRWYPKILKAQDPLVISIGWRRIQSQPIYAQEDPNGRLRYLKYTPLHMHCYAAFYAPVCPTNTGFVAIPSPEVRGTHFRCLATGYTIGNDSCTAVVKKLKLTGVPQKIQKTTTFIKGLFNSDIEAAKFVGAKLKTVSGIRGMIKTVIKGKNGIVRATFEDKILPSDIVFIRAWKPVEPPHYCAMVKNLVVPNWEGMKTMAQLRRAHNIPIPTRSDSEYKEIKRRRQVNEDEPVKVLVSRNTRMNLPFDMKQEFIPLEKRDAVQARVAAATVRVPEPRDMRRDALMDVFKDKADAMDARRKETKRIQRDRLKRTAEREQDEYEKKLKKAKKETARKQEFRTQHKSR